MVLDMINMYYEAGENEKALDLATRMADSLFGSLVFFMENYDYAKREMEVCYISLSDIADMADFYGDTELATTIDKFFDSVIGSEE
jgi:hypothetical protein